MKSPNHSKDRNNHRDRYDSQAKHAAELELYELDEDYLYHKHACRRQRQLESIHQRQYQREQTDQRDDERARRERLLKIALGISVAILGQLILSNTTTCSSSASHRSVDYYNQVSDYEPD